MPYLMARLKPALRPVAPRSTASLEARLLGAMGSGDEQAFAEGVREWEAYQRPRSLMSWGIYHLDEWGMELALRHGAMLSKKNLKAYFAHVAKGSTSSSSAEEKLEALRTWSAMWENLKSEPGFAHDALLNICSLWSFSPGQPVGMDWTHREFAGVMAYATRESLLNWDSTDPAGQGGFRVSPLMLAWVGADVSLCQALLMAGASPSKPCPSSSWPAWTFEKATRNVSGLLRESMKELGSFPMTAPSAKQARLFSPDPKISTLSGLAKERRDSLPHHREATLAGLVRWVPLDRSLPAVSPAQARPRF